jgi:uncharacterized protein (UPF0332 family)
VPTTREHIARARQNLAFAKSFDLKTTPYIDWVVTAYFYAALHLVDALLVEKDGVPGETHEIRKEYVKTKPYLRAIRDQYRTLKDHSEDARYRLITMTSHKIENTIIPLYEAIEKHIIPQFPKTPAA